MNKWEEEAMKESLTNGRFRDGLEKSRIDVLKELLLLMETRAEKAEAELLIFRERSESAEIKLCRHNEALDFLAVTRNYLRSLEHWMSEEGVGDVPIEVLDPMSRYYVASQKFEGQTIWTPILQPKENIDG